MTTMNFLETTDTVKKWREDFPQLKTLVREKPFIYFDNAATTLKPQKMIEAITQHYAFEVSNIHRGVHFNSETGTKKYEETREYIKNFLNARHVHEIIFTKGTTDSINLLANSYGEKFLQKGDVILLSEMEHHSNIVPWQMVAEKTGAIVKYIPIFDNGELDYEAYINLLKNHPVKILSITHVSNTLGTINPLKKIIGDLRSLKPEAHVMVDAAQSFAHLKLDVQDLDCDFLVFSAHKVFGPTGFGVLYGKEELLNLLPPYQGGGAMIHRVTFEKTTYHDLPNKFEAGTPAIAEGIAFIESLKYLNEIGFETIQQREDALLHYAESQLKTIPGLKLIGEAKEKSAVISFVIDGVHPQDLGTLLDQQGIAIRTGHHCTQPLMDHYRVGSTARASFTFYNTKEEIDFFIEAIKKSLRFLL